MHDWPIAQISSQISCRIWCAGSLKNCVLRVCTVTTKLCKHQLQTQFSDLIHPLPLKDTFSFAMCGIAAVLKCPDIPQLPDEFLCRATLPEHSSDVSPEPSIDNLLPFLTNRGPDQTVLRTVQIDAATKLHTVSTLLSLRTPPKEKCVDDRIATEILLFNGEIYGLPPSASDTEHIQALIKSLPPDEPLTPSHLDTLRGPWSIILWRPHERRLYFARDTLGRRSLLVCALPGLFAVTSISNHPAFVELPPVGVCYLDLSSCKFGVYSRPGRMVLPMRLTESALKTENDSYISFLPSCWLRSLDGHEYVDVSVAESVDDFLSYFRKSIKRRLAIKELPTATKPRYAALFSGGVDSLLIAAILDELLPQSEPLHLINVAFGENEKAIAACPDRITAIQGAIEVRALSQDREISLICVDVKPDEADHILETRVRSLVYPCDQPMDASIGTALWMAAQGKGYLHTSDYDSLQGKGDMTNSSRVLFSGLGADELMGGYKGRHRTTYRRYGVSGIAREMDADLSRLWFRNLGRDDRLIGDHGKEVRHPFLDEDLIGLVTSLPLVKHVCDLSQPDGIGDKQLLRRALQQIGFGQKACSRGKRAIQFGSRSKHVIERRRDR